jgi:ammonium transporter Rh
MDKIINADFAAGSILIAFGAVLGRLHLIQYLVMATIQTIVYGLSLTLCNEYFVANDIGGSITIHLFGAYFGLAVAMVVKRKDAMKDEKNTSNYYSNIFSMIGTIFLWMYWPSFNAALSSGNAQQRCLINTLISLTGSCVMVFLLTPFSKEGKLHMEYILNATLAGGVIIGSSADIIIYPWVSFLIGCAAGTISMIGFDSIGPFLHKTIELQDTCGVNSLHGMPGLLGGIISAFIAGYANVEDYGDSLTLLFPKRSLRTEGGQAIYQLITLGTSLLLAIASGIITGFILKLPCFETAKSLFDDNEAWVIDSEASDEEADYLNKKSTDNEKRKSTKKIKDTDKSNHSIQ